jgi:nucleoside-diphosphate-sugar epimerase
MKNTYEAHNVGSSKQYSVLDFITIFQEIVHTKLRFTWGKNKNYWKKFSELKTNKLQLNKKLLSEEVEKKVILSIAKVKKEFDWEPEFDIKYGLKQCLIHARKILKKEL